MPGVLNSATWVSVGLAGQIAIQISATAAFAKVIPPSAFGAYAAACVAIDLCQLLTERGHPAAIIQVSKLSLKVVDNAVRDTVTVGAMLLGFVLILSMLGLYIAADPLIPKTIALLSPIFIVGAIAKIYESSLQKVSRYSSIAKVNLFSAFLGYAVIGLLLLHMGLGVEVLLGATLSQWLTKAILLRILLSYEKLDSVQSWTDAKEDERFRIGITKERFWNYVIVQFDRAAIGASLGAEELGKYHIASYLLLPARYVGDVLDAILYPIVTRNSRDSNWCASNWIHITLIAAGASTVCSLSFAVCGNYLAEAFLGAEWGQTGDLMIVLAWTSVTALSGRLADVFNRATGATENTARRRAIVATTFVISVSAGVVHGAIGVCYAIGFTSLVNAILQMQLTVRLYKVRVAHLSEISFLLRATVATVLAAALAWLLLKVDGSGAQASYTLLAMPILIAPIILHELNKFRRRMDRRSNEPSLDVDSNAYNGRSD